MGSVTLLLGGVANARGLGLAVDLGAGAIALLSLTTLIIAVTMPRVPITRPVPKRAAFKDELNYVQ